MRKEVLLWAGAGQIGMAIARRIGYDKKIIVGDKKLENAQKTTEVMKGAGFGVTPVEMDLCRRTEAWRCHNADKCSRSGYH